MCCRVLPVRTALNYSRYGSGGEVWSCILAVGSLSGASVMHMLCAKIPEGFSMAEIEQRILCYGM